MFSGEKIRYYRKHGYMTQEQLAEVAGLSAAYISQVESGRRQIGKKAVQKIAEALNVHVSVFLEEVNLDEKNTQYSITKILSDCTPRELNIIYDTVLKLKQSLRINSVTSN